MRFPVTVNSYDREFARSQFRIKAGFVICRTLPIGHDDCFCYLRERRVLTFTSWLEEFIDGRWVARRWSSK